jgi:hypothetical protein
MELHNTQLSLENERLRLGYPKRIYILSWLQRLPFSLMKAMDIQYHVEGAEVHCSDV